MNTEWTRMEENILKSYFGRIPFHELCGMLPARSAGAVSTRAQQLQLNRKEKIRPDMPNTKMASTLEELRAEVAIKEAELAVDTTEQALTIFDDQMVSGFIGSETDIDGYVRTNSAKRSKMVMALSRARLKLAIARMKQKASV